MIVCARSRSAFAAFGVVVAATSAVSAQEYQFDFDASASGLNALIEFSANTAGTLIGNWNEETNPSGTRTKPGINPFAPFGATENVAVPMIAGLTLGDTVTTSTSGGFRMSFNAAAGTVTLYGYSANLVSGGPAELPLTVSLMYDGFRTRNPSAIFPGGFPIELPLGNATAETLTLDQSGPAAGTMTPVDGAPGSFDFAILGVGSLAGSFAALGTPIDLPATTVPLGFTGRVVFIGNTALIESITPIDFTQAQDLGLALPELPFDLPTVLPPGGTASLLLNLTLSDLTATLAGDLTIRAKGRIIPVPGTGVLIVLAGGGLVSRGRRRRA